jgi:hypothetical protein
MELPSPFHRIASRKAAFLLRVLDLSKPEAELLKNFFQIQRSGWLSRLQRYHETATMLAAGDARYRFAKAGVFHAIRCARLAFKPNPS